MRQGPPQNESARDRFWNERFAIGSAVLDRAETRGELRRRVDRRLTVKTLVGPLHTRLLLTREPLDDRFVERLVDLVITGIGRR